MARDLASRRDHGLRFYAGTIVILVTLGLTLSPSGQKPPDPISWCVACGTRGLADGILNLWLFIPLGLVLGWKSERPRAVFLFAFVLSVAIEIAQTMLPGRDPSFSDVVFNTAGAATGVLLARKQELWLVPAKAMSRILTMIAIVVAASVLVATAFLLSPADSSFSVVRSGDDLVLRFTTRASKLGLDGPEYRLRGAAAGASETTATVPVRHNRARWQIDRGSASPATLGPTVGQGWTLLAYPDAIGRRWGSVLNAIWIAAIFLPVGYWARGLWLGVAGAAAALLLMLIPAATGVVSASRAEWEGAGTGILSGVLLALLSHRLARRWEMSARRRPR